MEEIEIRLWVRDQAQFQEQVNVLTYHPRLLISTPQTPQPERGAALKGGPMNRQYV